MRHRISLQVIQKLKKNICFHVISRRLRWEILLRQRKKREYDIQLNLREVAYEDGRRLELALICIRCRSLVLRMFNLSAVLPHCCCCCTSCVGTSTTGVWMAFLLYIEEARCSPLMRTHSVLKGCMDKLPHDTQKLNTFYLHFDQFLLVKGDLDVGA